MQALLKLARNREETVTLARIFEQVELFPEMAVAMRAAAAADPHLDDDDRELLAVSMKHVVTQRRSGLRIAQSALEAERAQEVPNSRLVGLAERYVAILLEELTASCNLFLELLRDSLAPAADSTEAHVFYNKLRGDYTRYLAELTMAEEDISASHDFYARANFQAQRELRPLHPLRLGAALNTAVFFYEIRRAPDRALAVVRTAYEEAIADDNAGDAGEEVRQEATLILRVMHENMMLWQQEMAEWDPDADDGAVMQ